jgi:hypothetical protein
VHHRIIAAVPMSPTVQRLMVPSRGGPSEAARMEA